jgi:hypothetical protein
MVDEHPVAPGAANTKRLRLEVPIADIYIFVGPYVDCRDPTDFWPSDPVLGDEWDRLLNDRVRMEWNFSLSSTREIEVDGQKLYQFCGVPKERRPGAPRWTSRSTPSARG